MMKKENNKKNVYQSPIVNEIKLSSKFSVMAASTLKGNIDPVDSIIFDETL